MSYTFPTKKYPIAADVDALATFLAQRQSDSGTTNGGIVVAAPDMAVPQLGVDAAGLGLSYLKGISDAMMCAVGFQLESNNALSANSTTSTSYVDVPGSSITFTAPIAKTYILHADFNPFISAGSFGYARLVVNGNAGPDIIFDATALNKYVSIHLMHAAACSLGANTIKLQWKAGTASTANINTGSYANYIVSG